MCYYHFDALGSVTDLSNSSGQQVEHYTYSPFGKTKIYDPATGLKRDDSVVGNFYRFTARQWDSESNLYYYRARYYDASLGRFLQVDPVGYKAGSLNLYKYCSNNPLRFRDPTGLEGDDPSLKDLIDLLRAALLDLIEELTGVSLDDMIAMLMGDTPDIPTPEMPVPLPTRTIEELSGAKDTINDLNNALSNKDNLNNVLDGIFNGFDAMKGL